MGKWLAAAFLSSGLVYCGGGSGGSTGDSGVETSKTIGALSDAEVSDLCGYIGSLQQSPPHMVDCGGGIIITRGKTPDEIDAQVTQCIADLSPLDSCNATAGEVEDCAEENADLTDDEICDLINSPTKPPTSAACKASQDPSCDEPG
jgi:hypothetical protein